MKFKKYDYIFYIFFLLIPIIDTINGVLIDNKISFSIGQIYRISFLIILILIMVKENRNYINNIIIILIPFIVINLLHYFYMPSMNAIIYNFTSSSKLLSIFLIYYIYRKMYTLGNSSDEVIFKIIDKLIVLFPLSILIPNMLNIGLNVYSNGAGYKGFYKSNNELSIVILVMTLFAINKFITKPTIRNNIILFINIISLLMIGAKTSIIGLIIILIWYSRKVIKNILINKRILINIALIIILFILFREKIVEVWDKIFARQEFFYNKNNSFINLILSGRNNYLKNSLEALAGSKVILLRVLFGVGSFFRINNLVEGKIIEMDFFDIFFSYGLIVLIIIIYFLFKIYKDKGNNDLYNFNMAFVIIIMFSFVAGHIMLSGLGGNILTLVLMGMIKNKRGNYCS